MTTPPRPSIAERATNATLAATRIVGAVIEGEPVRVTPDERNARVEVCSKCPAFDEIFGQCHVCGCYIVLKSWLRTENCPSRKWAGDTDQA